MDKKATEQRCLITWNKSIAWCYISIIHLNAPSFQRDVTPPTKKRTPQEPLQKLLELRYATTWSFSRCSVGRGGGQRGLNWGLVLPPIKRCETNISVKYQLHPPPVEARRSHFDICVKQGLQQILPLQAQSSYLGKSQLSLCVCGGGVCAGLCVCLCHTYPWYHCFSTNMQVCARACVCVYVSSIRFALVYRLLGVIDRLGLV